jgi:hypothetical protein
MRNIKPYIKLTKIWEDDDIKEFNVVVFDGKSKYSNDVYIGYNLLTELVKDLLVFREHVHGGLYDIKFGEFGFEYANGGFQARLNYHLPGKLYISTYQQSEYIGFPKNQVASEAKMHLITEPVLFDNFIH